MLQGYSEASVDDIAESKEEKNELAQIIYEESLRLSRVVDDLFFFQAEDGIRDYKVTGVQTCALPISKTRTLSPRRMRRRPFTLAVVSLARANMVRARARSSGWTSENGSATSAYSHPRSADRKSVV